jgi:hypothetical protein
VPVRPSNERPVGGMAPAVCLRLGAFPHPRRTGPAGFRLEEDTVGGMDEISPVGLIHLNGPPGASLKFGADEMNCIGCNKPKSNGGAL